MSAAPTREAMLAGIRAALEDYGRYGEVRVQTMAELYRLSMADWRPQDPAPTLTSEAPSCFDGEGASFFADVRARYQKYCEDRADAIRDGKPTEFTEAELKLLNLRTYKPKP